MSNLAKMMWFMIISALLVVSCQQTTTKPALNTRSPYLLVETASETGWTIPRSIYKISTDGSQVEHIYDFGERVSYWFSPDLRYVAFTGHIPDSDASKPDLMVLDLSTKQIVTQIPDITLYRGDVVWSSGSNRFLFNKTQFIDGSTDWWIYDIFTDSQERLTDEISIKWFPSWSQDDRYIAYVATPCSDYGDVCRMTSEVWDITVVNVETKAARKVTDFINSNIDIVWGSSDAIFCNLKWSFDSKYIAFENQCMENSGSIYERHRIFTVNVENMFVQEALKFNHTHEFSYAYNYHWLETGHLRIGYDYINSYNYQTFSRGGVLEFNPFQAVSTNSPELLGFKGNLLDWAPNGQTFVVFTQEPFFEINPNNQGFGGQLNGSGATLLGEFIDGNLTIFPTSTDLPYSLCFDQVGYWSLDGQYVAYSSTGQQHVCNQSVTNADVYVYSLETGELNNITQGLDGISRPLGWLIPDNP